MAKTKTTPVTKPVSLYMEGYRDFNAGRKPVAKPSKDYLEGYADAQKDSTSNRDRPAYYEAEGGSMCNGIGRSYF